MGGEQLWAPLPGQSARGYDGGLLIVNARFGPPSSSALTNASSASRCRGLEAAASKEEKVMKGATNNGSRSRWQWHLPID